MKLNIELVISKSKKFLEELGFNAEESKWIIRNIIEAEIAGKHSHGLMRLKDYEHRIRQKKIVLNSTELTKVRDTEGVLFFDGKGQSGMVGEYRSIDLAIKKFKDNPDLASLLVGISNLSYATGFIGDYARIVAEQGLIYIGFHNSNPVLIPHGSSVPQWGTNPLSFSFPIQGNPIIVDMSSSKITWGDMKIKAENKESIDDTLALDKQGRPTSNASEALKGGILPFGGHKGSGLGMMVELLAGALTGSRVGPSINKGWGSFYIIINPGIFRKAEDVIDDAGELLNELKSNPKQKGIEEVLYPGEQSQRNRMFAWKTGELNLDESIYELIKDY